MTDKDILNFGYHEYPVGPFDADGVIANFQKCIKDEMGKKYFLNIHKYEEWVHPHTKERIPESYEFETYFVNHSNEPVKMLFYAGWTIESFEKYAEQLFNTGLFQYYEHWDEC